jgi:cobalt-zinc-cadmium efflux system membrane fusion protein
MPVVRKYLPLLIASLLCVGLSGRQVVASGTEPVGPYGPSIPLTALGKAAIGIEVQVVEKTSQPMEISVPGKIEVIPTRQFDEHAPLSGRISAVSVWPGEQVKQGQVLAVIDSLEMNSLAAQLLQSKLDIESENARQKGMLDEEVRQAEQRLELALANQKRTLKLFENKIAPQKDVMAAESEYELAKTRLKTATENRRIVLKMLQSKIDLTLLPLRQRLKMLGVDETQIQHMLNKQETLTSVPVQAARSGVITAISASPGKSIDPSVSLFTIADLSKVWATAQVYEEDMSRMKVGEPVLVKVHALAGEKVEGLLTYIGNQVDPLTRTLPVRAEIDNPGFRLKPDMYAELYIQTAHSVPLVALPKDAIVQKGTAHIVFLETKDGYQPTYVKLGRTMGEVAEVTEGLTVGEKVVTRGAFQLGAQLLKNEGGEGMFVSPTESAHEPDEKTTTAKNSDFNLNLQTVIVSIAGAFILGFAICALFMFRKQSPPVVFHNQTNEDAAAQLKQSIAQSDLNVEPSAAAKSKTEG